MPVEKGDSSDSHVSSDARKDQNSFPHWLIHKEEGPGIVGLELSRVNERLRDLETDNALPTLERKRLQAFYTRERSKLRLRLAVLGKTEKVKSAESAFEEIGKALDCTRSEARRLGEDEVRTDDCRRSLAEALLIKTRSELEAASSALEELRGDDRSWDDQKAAARRWELSRKWEAITPDELRPAVEALRYRFEHYGCWQSAESCMKLCYAALHPASPNESSQSDPEDLNPYKRFLIGLLGPQVSRALLGPDHPAPVIFRSYLDILEAALKVVVRGAFKQMYEIAKVQASLLGKHPVEWTKRQLEILISAEKARIRSWIKEVCDPRDFSKTGLIDEALFWGSWRVPRLIHMKPAGNTPYDESGAWAREELVRSEELLEARADRLTEFLRIELEQVVRAAHIEFAKQGSEVRASRHDEYHARANSVLSTPLLAGTSASDMWRNLHDKFRALAEEEQRLAPHNNGDRWLRAYIDYKESSTACRECSVSEGVNEVFRERFLVEATRAGIALASTLKGEACDIWIHHVFSHLLEHGSKLLFAASKEGGIILRACAASAIYCARLEKDALIAGMKRAVPNSSRLGAMGAATNQPVGEGLTQTASPNQTVLEAIVRKVQNPQAYSALSVPDAALYYQVRPRTVHRWIAEGKLRRGGRRGSVTIESIQNWDKKRSRKPRSI